MQQTFLRNHLSRCVSTAMKNGRGEAIIDELMGALKYDTSLKDDRGALGTDRFGAGSARCMLPHHSSAGGHAGNPLATAHRRDDEHSPGQVQ